MDSCGFYQLSSDFTLVKLSPVNHMPDFVFNAIRFKINRLIGIYATNHLGIIYELIDQLAYFSQQRIVCLDNCLSTVTVLTYPSLVNLGAMLISAFHHAAAARAYCFSVKIVNVVGLIDIFLIVFRIS